MSYVPGTFDSTAGRGCTKERKLYYDREYNRARLHRNGCAECQAIKKAVAHEVYERGAAHRRWKKQKKADRNRQRVARKKQRSS